MKNQIKYNTLLIIGFLLFCLIIWNKFIRVRMPKDIPFNITEIGFYIYLSIIITSLYLIVITIYNYLFPKRNTSVFQPIVLKLSLPLQVLDTYFKDFSLWQRFLSTAIKKLIVFFHKQIKKYLYIYLFSTIIPKGFIIIMFLLDIFYFHKLNYFYKSLILLTIPIIIRYIFYTFDKEFYKMCIILDKQFEIHCYSLSKDNYVPIITSFEYIKQRCLSKLQIISDKPFDCLITLSDNYINSLKIEKSLSIDHKTMIANFEKRLDWIIYFYPVFYQYQKIKNKYDRWITLIQAIAYIIGWTYLLYICPYIFPFSDVIDLVTSIKEIEEPFSTTILEI